MQCFQRSMAVSNLMLYQTLLFSKLLVSHCASFPCKSILYSITVDDCIDRKFTVCQMYRSVLWLKTPHCKTDIPTGIVCGSCIVLAFRIFLHSKLMCFSITSGAAFSFRIRNLSG